MQNTVAVRARGNQDLGVMSFGRPCRSHEKRFGSQNLSLKAQDARLDYFL